MAIKVADNFSYLGAKPLDARLQFATVNEMVASPVATLYDGCFAYVKGTKKYYSFDSTNDVDVTLGKWREYSSGSGSDSSVVEGYLNPTNGKFYEESTYTTEITGEAEKIYVALDTDLIYRHDFTNGFVLLSESTDGTIEGYLNPTDGKFYEESTYTTEITGEAGKLYVTLDTDKTYRYDSTNGFVEIGGGDTIQYSTMPTADATTLGKFVQYIGTTTSSYTHGYFYECVSNGAGTYSWEVRNIQDSEQIQYAVMPTADSAHENMIVQYTGATNSTYTNGLFYVCVSDGAVTPTYSWEQKPVEPKEVVQIAKADFDLLPTAKKNDGTAYFIPDADMVDNITVMGNRFDKANIYTATERMIGSYLGKPLYQKTITIPSDKIPNNNNTIIAIGTNNISEIVSFDGMLRTKDSIAVGTWTPIPRIQPNSYDKNMGIDISASNSAIYLKGSGFDYTSVFDHGYITIQYTKTTDGTVTIGSPNDYSTDEMIIGTWIDGSTLYQKTLNVGTVSKGESSVPHNISNFGGLVACFGRCSYGSNGYYLPMPYVSVNSSYCVDLGNVNATSVGFNVGSSFNSLSNVVVTLQYTKSV